MLSFLSLLDSHYPVDYASILSQQIVKIDLKRRRKEILETGEILAITIMPVLFVEISIE
jgi:hypothetical protein